MNRNEFTIWIGIDSGVETGLARWNKPEKKLALVHSVMIHQALFYVRILHEANPGKVFVRVEDARLRKNPKFYGPEGAAKLQGVGSVKRDAKIWEDFLKDHGIPFVMVHPSNTKMTSDYFKKLTGWTTPTNEHARDAAILVFGM